MYADLNVPFEPTSLGSSLPTNSNPKPKQKQTADSNSGLPPVTLSATDNQAIEARIDILVYLGYTVIGLNQIIQSKFDPTTHRNHLLGIKNRTGIVLLRRLTIVLDEVSEKGTGLTNNNISALSGYDIISLQPTTTTTFSQACLSHSVPSPLTSHIITLDLASQPRLPFHLKLSLVKTAVKNGAVFEICYASALAIGDESKRRNWWANARELFRVTGGKGLLVSSGGIGPDVRGPNDVINLAALLGINQDKGKDAITKIPKSVIIRAQTRKTYRAVLSQPTLVLPANDASSSLNAPGREEPQPSKLSTSVPTRQMAPPQPLTPSAAGSSVVTSNLDARSAGTNLQKRGREDEAEKAMGKKKKKRQMA